MAYSDKRHFDAAHPIVRAAFSQQSWASGNTDVLTPTLANMNFLVESITVVISNATNGITFTVTITDQDSTQLYTQAAIPENASTLYLATKATPDFPAFPVADDTLTATMTPSGDPGASGVTVDLILRGP